MRRRQSGSSAEEEDSQTVSAKSRPNDADKSSGSHTVAIDQTQENMRDTSARKSLESAASLKSPKDLAPRSERHSLDKSALPQSPDPQSEEKREADMTEPQLRHRARLRSPWACSILTLTCTALAFAVLGLVGQSFLVRQLDPKGCAMSYMGPAYAKFDDFDTEYTRFASKYSLYLYREAAIDDDTRVCWTGEYIVGR